MAQLLVRGLDGEVKVRLQARAARQGQSMEADARDILRDALKYEVRPASGLGTRIARRFDGLKPGETIGELKRPVRDVIVLDTNVVSALMQAPYRLARRAARAVGMDQASNSIFFTYAVAANLRTLYRQIQKFRRQICPYDRGVRQVLFGV